MAGSSLLTLIDDIASILDDVSLMTKIAAKKTAGVLGDDLALNAQQVTGVTANRELPVVFAVAKGSLKNKAILVPAALAISAFAPWAVTPLLMLGGAFLCYEGFEKVAHKLLHSRAEDEAHHDSLEQALKDPKIDLLAYEQDKVKGAVRTDFILSAEIIAITLGTVAESAFTTQVAVLAVVAAIMTAFVYGLVAGIVKLDDLGLYLSQKNSGPAQATGAGILWAAPFMMKSLSIIGTVAMFMVGGGILTHGLPFAHHLITELAERSGEIGGIGGLLRGATPVLLQILTGVITGAIVLIAVKIAERIIRGLRRQTHRNPSA